ncbi:MAG TPA: hypothetical protein VG755_31845 [Nannocystaceae bacterium]|nr:hypothetical protein [Nannocystaceae bacterium]
MSLLPIVLALLLQPPATPPVVAEAELAPLSETLRSRFDVITRDPPHELIRKSHYWTGNERSLHLWHHALADRGGAYLGVGTDQNYLLAGWAKSELVVVVDFDQAIIDLHRSYIAFLEHAETPEQFLALWSEEGMADALTVLQARWGDDPRWERIRRVYKVARRLVAKRLAAVMQRTQEHGIATFIDDATQYQHVRALAQSGRVIALRGDYAGAHTLAGVAEVLHEAGLRLGVIYLSNLEQYVDYTPQFRRNLLAFDVADDAVVVRTLGWRSFGFAPGEHYHYNVQPAPLFAGWLRHNRVKRLPDLLLQRTKTGTRGLSILDREPVHSKTPPVIAR